MNLGSLLKKMFQFKRLLAEHSFLKGSDLMKKLIITLFALSSFSVFASDLYVNCIVQKISKENVKLERESFSSKLLNDGDLYGSSLEGEVLSDRFLLKVSVYKDANFIEMRASLPDYHRNDRMVIVSRSPKLNAEVLDKKMNRIKLNCNVSKSATHTLVN